MATIVDNTLYKLNRKAFQILSSAYEKMPEIAIQAINSYGSPKQPKLEAQLIQIGALIDQIAEVIVLNDAGTAIVGIKDEDVSVVNALFACLREVAEIEQLTDMPIPFATLVPYDCCTPFPVGTVGSILVSDGTEYVAVTPTDIGQVPIWDGTAVIWGAPSLNGIPAGGLAGQVLMKNSNTSYDVIWAGLTLSDIGDVTATAAEVNVLDGVNTGSIGAPQINTLIGINTGLTIQQQLDAKVSAVLNNGQFLVGSALNVPTAVTPTGDVTFNSAGVFAISNGVIVNTDISTSAAIMRNKLASGSTWRVIINNGSGVMSEASSIIANRALISDSNGIPTHSGVTATVLGHISTLSSNAQDQLNVRLEVNLTPPVQGDTLTFNGTDWVNLGIGAGGTVLSSNGTSVFWGPSSGNGIPSGGTTHQYLRKIDNTNYNTEWHTLILADVSDVIATATEVNILSGVTTTTAQLNYLNTTTSDVQIQLNNKLNNTLPYNAIFVGDAGNHPIPYAAGNEGEVLTINAGVPIWQAPSPPGDVSGVSPTTDNAIARWNGVDGDSIQNSGIIIDDSDILTTPANIVIQNQQSLQLFDGADAFSVDLRASASMPASYVITLPSIAPSTNTVLMFDGADYIWGVGGGGGSSTLAKSQNFTSVGGDTFTVSNGVLDMISYVAINGVVQQDTQYTVSGQNVTFTSNVTSGFNVIIGYFEGASVIAPFPFTTLTDVPSTYAGQAGKVVAVNPSETGLIFVTGGGGGGGGWPLGGTDTFIADIAIDGADFLVEIGDPTPVKGFFITSKGTDGFVFLNTQTVGDNVSYESLDLFSPNEFESYLRLYLESRDDGDSTKIRRVVVEASTFVGDDTGDSFYQVTWENSSGIQEKFRMSPDGTEISASILIIQSTSTINIDATGNLTQTGVDITLTASNHIHLAATNNLTLEGASQVDFVAASFLLNGNLPVNPTTEFFRGDGTWAEVIMPGAWSTTVAGLVEMSTQAEAEAITTQAAATSGTTGLSDSRTPSEIGLYNAFVNMYTKASTWALKQTFTTAPRFSSATASRLMTTDSNKDLASLAYADLATLVYAVASGTNTYTASLSTALTAYVTGQIFYIKFTNASTSTTPTLNVDSVGAKTIVKVNSSALVSGDISAGQIYELIYDGTNLRILGIANYGVLEGLTVNGLTASSFVRTDSSKALTTVSSASQSDMITGTDDTKPATALSVENKGSEKSVTISNAASGSISHDCLSRQKIKFVYNTTVTGNITVTRTNDSNVEYIHVIFAVTGSGITITFPSDVRMVRSLESSIWNQSSKILTISSTGTADWHQYTLTRTGSTFLLTYDGPYRA